MFGCTCKGAAPGKVGKGQLEEGVKLMGKEGQSQPLKR